MLGSEKGGRDNRLPALARLGAQLFMREALERDPRNGGTGLTVYQRSDIDAQWLPCCAVITLAAGLYVQPSFAMSVTSDHHSHWGRRAADILRTTVPSEPVVPLISPELGPE
jgi:hypothetical protein